MKTIKITVNKNEEKIVPFVWIDDDDMQVSLDAYLTGEGATLTIVGIFLGKKHNAVVFNTNVVHNAPNTKSRTEIRGVFLNHSAIDNDGMVRINKGAKGADGYFTSKILLFDDAKGKSVPSLEIDENDLKAGHASTVGRPDAEQILYLRSRGLTEKQAERLLIQGFFKPVIKLLSIQEMKDVQQKIHLALNPDAAIV